MYSLQRVESLFSIRRKVGRLTRAEVSGGACPSPIMGVLRGVIPAKNENICANLCRFCIWGIKMRTLNS